MKRLTNEEFIRKFNKNNEDHNNYKILDKYKNSRTPIRVKHINCGNIYYAIPRELMRGKNRCSKCYQKAMSSKLRKDKSNVIRLVKKVLGADYSIIACDFLKVGTKFSYYLTIKHLVCGKVYKIRQDHITSDHRKCSCTRRTKSVGEELLVRYFKNNSINFVHPMLFDDLIDKQKLHYDFYLPNLNVLVEYQGMQHYYKNHQITRKGHNAHNVWSTQIKHDNMKRQYAHNNGYILIEVPYIFGTYDRVAKYTSKQIAIKCKK
ncbi:group I intron protein [Lactobacillus phage LpeD]|uniref:Group I intron protein n=1 Tax=Lactobacillus phage LpeD TaxID=2041210 RepID=A0A291I9F3_9CAUD|nr:HNH endonuclease [Lactobacillus phage LpeD]ATG86314.1 group I intron protein [Lactobacillus phage LpeD]